MAVDVLFAKHIASGVDFLLSGDFGSHGFAEGLHDFFTRRCGWAQGVFVRAESGGADTIINRVLRCEEG